jgi:hypothetical protein
MTPTKTLGQNLETSYGVLIIAVQEAFKASTVASESRQALKAHQQAVILEHAEDPKALGSNEAARTARIAELTVDSSDHVRLVEVNERLANHKVEIARLELEADHAQLRILELVAKFDELEAR